MEIEMGKAVKQRVFTHIYGTIGESRPYLDKALILFARERGIQNVQNAVRDQLSHEVVEMLYAN
jgi:hypothetical protein